VRLSPALCVTVESRGVKLPLYSELLWGGLGVS
jgi:hypothetical protein